MTPQDDALKSLRDALRAAPDNVALRQAAADLLFGFSRYEEAEREYRTALQLSPESVAAKLGLAKCFLQQAKHSAAAVIVEELIKKPDSPPAAHLLHARVLLAQGDTDAASRAYRRAIDLEPSLADPELAQRVGASDWKEEEDERLRAPVEEGGGPPDIELERPSISFKDVGGMDGVKEEIRMKIIHPMANPEIFKAYGKKIGGGILLYGPPGCGKTYLARATAGEIKAKFMSVGLHDVLDMFIGQSEKNLHEIFETARRHAPCVLFFDEVDALGASRSDMRHSAGRLTINQFLSELDGVASDNEGILILGATNAPWHLDTALRRPGRFDRILFVPPPDAAARAAIFRILVKGKPTSDIDFDHLAKKTEGFSGADLKAIVDGAVESKLRDAMKEGVPKPIATRDIAAAIGGQRPTTKEWFSTARNYALYSNQGGMYDEILKFLKL